MNNNAAIPFYDFGGQGKTLHFAHANGYPPESYQQLIQPFLADHRVIASKFRPLWSGQNPNQIKTWRTFADDLIRFMDEHQMKNVIGMGHSMGGTISAIAALKRPDLFEQLILLDPVIFSRKFLFFTQILPIFLLKKIIPIAKISARRRNRWESKEEVYISWRTKKIFRNFSDLTLNDFIQYAIVPHPDGGMTLAYPREWETQVYATAPYVFSKMVNLKIPLTVIKGKHSNVITNKLWEEWQTLQPHANFIEFKNAGHLVPMEFPKEVAEKILKLL